MEELSQVTIDLVEKNFPKGQCQERGKAIVLHAEMLLAIVDYLIGKESENKDTRNLTGIG